MKRAVIPSILVVVVLLAVAVIAQAQQPAKVPRIGYVSGSGDPKAPGPLVEGFRQGLRDLGYIEEKNILVEYRYAEGKLDRIPGLVRNPPISPARIRPAPRIVLSAFLVL